MRRFELIDAKTGKGYAGVEAEQPTTEQPTTEQAPAEQPDLSAPWADRPYDVTGLRISRPSRRFPEVGNPPGTPGLTWHDIARAFCSHPLTPTPGVWQQAVAEADLVHREHTDTAPSRKVLLVLLGAGLADDGSYSAQVSDQAGATRALIAKLGLRSVVALLLDSLGSLTMKSEYVGSGHRPRFRVYADDDVSTGVGMDRLGVRLNDLLGALGDALATAPETEYTQCVSVIRGAFDGLSPARRLPMVLLVPDEHDLSDALGRDLLGKTATLPEGVPAQALLRSAADPEVIRFAARDTPEYVTCWHDEEFCNVLVREYGAEAVSRLAPGAREEAAGLALGAIGTPEAVGALIDVASMSKGALARLTGAVRRWPEAGAVALAKAAAGGGRDASLAEPMLTRVLSERPDVLTRVRPFADRPAQAALDRAAQRVAGPAEVAETTDLPRVLASPPWLGKRAKVTIPVVVGLQPLPLPDQEVWPDGLREQLLVDESWVMRNADKYQVPGKALNDLLRCRQQNAPGIAPLLQQARAAAERGDADAMVAAWLHHLRVERENSRYTWHSLDGSAITHLPNGIGPRVWNGLAGETTDYLYGTGYAAVTLGLAGLPGTARLVQRRPADHAALAMPFRSVTFAPVMARCMVRLKSAGAHGRAWLLAHPEHAAAGLIVPALGGKGEAKDIAVAGLRMLADQGHRDLVEEVATRYGRDDVTAGVRAVLDLDPLQQVPSRIPALSAWWQPRLWSRPRLAGGKALPDDALDALGVMFALPRGQGLYPGIEQAVAACDRASLAVFGWEMFSAWLSSGAPSRDSWALSTLALIGDDDTARRLTPFLRAWPGESQHARAVAGLEVLAGIGTDVALMELNGIAQKVKFKGLQDKAREKIAQIAEDREMTTEELADRLAPDLGLDGRGTLTLDFGTRRFTVGFDEVLAPFVRDGEGRRLKDLPRPRAGDDAQAAKAATATYRQLKKDARTVCAQQVFRFELAMTHRRRWAPKTFTELIVGHPLVGHVARRLVWGLYEPAADNPNPGGELRSVFRVAEDVSLSDVHDEELQLPDGLVVGVVHALELPPGDAAAMGQLFADYEIGQPFPQLGRDTYPLTGAERAATELKRWEGREFPTAKLLGLTNRGWRRGTPQDSGWVWHYTRDLGDGRAAQFNLDPGLVVGAPDFEPVQKGVSIVVGSTRWEEVAERDTFASLHPVTASELVREAEILTQGANS